MQHTLWTEVLLLFLAFMVSAPDGVIQCGLLPPYAPRDAAKKWYVSFIRAKAEQQGALKLLYIHCLTLTDALSLSLYVYVAHA